MYIEQYYYDDLDQCIYNLRFLHSGVNGRGNYINIESDLYIKKNIYETFVPSIKTIESLCVKINNNFRSKIINDKLCGQFKNITIILQFNDI